VSSKESTMAGRIRRGDRIISGSAVHSRSVRVATTRDDPSEETMKALVVMHDGRMIDATCHGAGGAPGPVSGGIDGIVFGERHVRIDGPEHMRVLGSGGNRRRSWLAGPDSAALIGREPLVVATRHGWAGQVGADGIEWLEWHGMIAGGRSSWRIWADLVRAADATAPVWVHGESGTGKERAAATIHAFSPRHQGPFVTLNCAALPENLVEAELFGVARGAFTGADRDRPGAFQRADGGTLFLDEVGELSAATQAKLLRVLESGDVARVGAGRTERVDVRVVAATWRDLEKEAAHGRFRHDLLHRLFVLRVDLPPLRARPDDIMALIAARLSARGALHLMPPPAMRQALSRLSWPGNVRQLFNQVERALVHDDVLQLLPVTRGPADGAGLPRRTSPSRESNEHEVRRHAARLIERQLDAHRGNRTRAAESLGVSRSTLYRWLRTGVVTG
jgi:transcriptional regulator with AAA-type ATPase domain